MIVSERDLMVARAVRDACAKEARGLRLRTGSLEAACARLLVEGMELLDLTTLLESLPEPEPAPLPAPTCDGWWWASDGARWGIHFVQFGAIYSSPSDTEPAAPQQFNSWVGPLITPSATGGAE